ncbi:MAG: hypothetical protein P1V51_05180 [Deltaproteobacteria bacterium]|nr:hypothetical protein [Deltaproteobacteria bacterium]
MRPFPMVALAALLVIGPARAEEKPAPAAEAEAPATRPPLPDADAFYRRARERHAPMFERYAGTETTMWQRVARRHSETLELRSHSKIKVIVRDFYFAPRQIEVLEYWEDGEKKDPSDYTDRGGKEPRHPLLHSSAPENYRVSMIGRRKKAGHDCIALKIEGREKTPRHLEGTLWIDEETLDLVAVDVHPAKTPFGVKSIEVDMRFRQEGDAMLSMGGETRVHVHVPLVFPNNLLIITDEVLAARGIPK